MRKSRYKIDYEDVKLPSQLKYNEFHEIYQLRIKDLDKGRKKKKELTYFQ